MMLYFNSQSEIVCWFDTPAQAQAVGVPEGELDEFMLGVAGPVAITQKAYASTGRVKAVIIKHFGSGAVERSQGVPLEALREFAAKYGLEFISRPRRAHRELSFNDGRYYSHEHEPDLHE